jgi:CMP-N-acetylneuraminic acid synthetase
MNDYSLTALISIPEEAGYFFPNRHFEYISGKPLYRIMIEKLEAINNIGKIIINTDSRSIKSEYSRSPKTKVIDVYHAEPQEIELELTSDRLTTELLKHTEGEHFLQLGTIFPFVKPETINRAIEIYDEHIINAEHHHYDSVFSIKTLNRRYYDSDTDFIREDRPNTFVEDGILHIFNRNTFQANGNRKVGKKPYLFGIDEIENFAVDSEENHQITGFISDHRNRFPRVFGR